MYKDNLIFLILIVSILQLSGYSKNEGRPHIMMILVDDLGYNDLGCYGHPWHHTPNIDLISQRGIRFPNAYAPAPICSASRASILTGKSTPRLGMEFVVKKSPGQQEIVHRQKLQAPDYVNQLNPDEKTIAEYLVEAGYETAYFGKWHLNPHYQKYLGWHPESGPQNHGFNIAEEDFGTHPYNKTEFDELPEKGTYHPDGITQKAISFLDRNHTDPFFLMVSHFYVHTPVESPYQELKDKYHALIPNNAKNRMKRIEYAAFLETLDHYVGQLLTALKDNNLENNTLVIFYSDNGGHPEYTANGPLRGSKWNLYEGGIRVPMLMMWRSRIKPGSACKTPVIGYDILPTCLEAAGIEDLAIDDVDGISVFPMLEKSEQFPDRSLFWHFPYYHPEKQHFAKAIDRIGVDDFSISKTRPHSAILKSGFKLIYFYEENRSELYRLEDDVSEQSNLAKELSDRGEIMEVELKNYLQQVSARMAYISND